MTLSTFFFVVFSLAALAFAVGVVAARRLLRAAVCLAGTVLATAGLYLTLRADFLAAVQLLVYLGGIVVLLVFAIMLTADTHDEKAPLQRRALAALAAGAFGAVNLYAIHGSGLATAALRPQPAAEFAEIGRRLLTAYAIPFELISLLLLAVLVGAIVVARKPEETP